LGRSIRRKSRRRSRRAGACGGIGADRPTMDAEWVVTIGAAIVLLVGAGGTMARAARRGAEWQARVEERWREAAAELGGTLTAGPPTTLGPRRLTLSVERAEVTATAEVNVPVDPGAPS